LVVLALIRLWPFLVEARLPGLVAVVLLAALGGLARMGPQVPQELLQARHLTFCNTPAAAAVVAGVSERAVKVAIAVPVPVAPVMMAALRRIIQDTTLTQTRAAAVVAQGLGAVAQFFQAAQAAAASSFSTSHKEIKWHILRV
jgi:predicted component of type VI protein secretion system